MAKVKEPQTARVEQLERATAQLEARLREALAERDRALADLARARARLATAKLEAASAGEAAVPDYPATSGPGPAPLRYLVVDAANDGLKALLGPLHGGLKQLAQRVLPKGD